MWRSIVRVAVSTIAWAVVHSGFASRKFKGQVVRRVGLRRYHQFYRPFYTVQSAASVAALAVYTRSLPDRELYHIRGTAARWMQAGQLLSLAYFLWAVYHAGAARLSGASNLLAALEGKDHTPDSEGQGPSPRNAGGLQISGPFLLSRHPLNFAAIPLLWLFPRMGVKLAAFNTIATLYFYLGSFHEESRLQAAYGVAYDRYRNSGVPFFLPGPPAETLPDTDRGP